MARSKRQRQAQARSDRAPEKQSVIRRILHRGGQGLGIRLTAEETVELATSLKTNAVRITVLEGLVEEYQRMLDEEDEEEPDEAVN